MIQTESVAFSAFIPLDVPPHSHSLKAGKTQVKELGSSPCFTISTSVLVESLSVGSFSRYSCRVIKIMRV